MRKKDRSGVVAAVRETGLACRDGSIRRLGTTEQMFFHRKQYIVSIATRETA